MNKNKSLKGLEKYCRSEMRKEKRERRKEKWEMRNEDKIIN